jgi:hypothetical protein
MEVLNVKNWMELALKRKSWNDLVEKSKNPQMVVNLMEEEQEEECL